MGKNANRRADLGDGDEQNVTLSSYYLYHYNTDRYIFGKMKAKKLSVFEFNADVHHHCKELMENIPHQFPLVEKLKLLFVCIFGK